MGVDSSIFFTYLNKLQRMISLVAQDINEQTSVYLSALGGHVDVVEYLLSFRVHALNPQEVELFKRRSTHSYFTSESN